MEQIKLGWERPQYSVSELTNSIARTLEGEFSGIWVSGEISGMKMATSGHCYFTLKDSQAQIRAVVWKSAYRMLRAKPGDGLMVLARGRVEVYPPRGEYQLIVEAMEPVGLGALQLAFDRLRKKLADEGLFEAERKKPLPKLPRRIGIVTSPTGAVIRDMLNVFERRFPGLQIRIYPAMVQGQGSIEQVVEGINYFGRGDWAELLIVARGGGSLEDLWTFNEEAVARAIVASLVPVISAVGHETDFTISDFVADLRAPTPSAAAELAVPTLAGLLDQATGMERRLEQVMRYRIAEAARKLEVRGVERGRMLLQRRIYRAGQRVDELEGRAGRLLQGRMVQARRRWQALDGKLRQLDLRLRVGMGMRRLDSLAGRLQAAVRVRIGGAKQRLAPLGAELVQLSPLKILERGYSIVETAEGRVVSDPATVKKGQVLGVRLAQGRIDVKVSRIG